MPRQRIYHKRNTYELPDDFPQRLERFQEESGLSWSEIARRLGTYRHTVWRWAREPGCATRKRHPGVELTLRASI